jgi:HEAT repeat protein
MKFQDWKDALKSPEASIRSDAADALPVDGEDEAVVALLARALSDEDELVRTCAADSLGHCHLESARSALRVAIATERQELPLAYMLCSLGMIGDPVDYTVLSSKLLDKTSSTRIIIDSAEGIVHLALSNSVSAICDEYLKSMDQLDRVGLPSLQRIVSQMNRAIAHIEKIARAQISIAGRASEKEGLQNILDRIEKRLTD